MDELTAPSLPTPEGTEPLPHEPPALETALTWLAKVRPAAALALLREPEFAFISMTAFAGFRVNATGYANPLVRKRLAQEAVREEKFAGKLRALAEEAATVVAVIPSPTPQTSTVKDKNEAARQEALRTDRDRRRRERDEARQALAEAEAARGEADNARRNAEAERDEAHRLAQHQTHRVERLDRQVAKLHAEQAGLLRALRHQTADTSAPSVPDSTPALASGTAGKDKPLAAPSSETSPWQAAVAHLLDKRKYDVALGLAEDVLRTSPENPEALDIAARAHEGRDEPRLAVPFLHRLLSAQLSQGGIPEAAETLLRLLRRATPSETERDVRAFMAVLRLDDASAVEQTRGVLARLRGLQPDAFDALVVQLRSVAPPALAEALMPTPGLPGLDDILPLPTSPPLTARRLLRAIDAGEASTVAQAQEALSRLCQTDPAAKTRVRQTLERTAGEDDTYLTTLFGRQRGAAVVDGSNAAWFDQESLVNGRPRLRPLLGLRRVLRGQGYFPILLYADAPLPYTIDEPERLREMAARGEITIVDGGVDADEILLRAAKQWKALLVTNDHMNDWDPLGEVPKIRFTIAANGGVILLPGSN